MKLSELYVQEFKPGGRRHCLKCQRQSHGKWCGFCIDKELRSLGVSQKTMRLASAVIRRGNPVKIQQAIEAIEREIK